MYLRGFRLPSVLFLPSRCFMLFCFFAGSLATFSAVDVRIFLFIGLRSSVCLFVRLRFSCFVSLFVWFTYALYILFSSLLRVVARYYFLVYDRNLSIFLYNIISIIIISISYFIYYYVDAMLSAASSPFRLFPCLNVFIASSLSLSTSSPTGY